MKMSTRARYAIRALIDIAANANGKPVLLRDVARRQEISRMYLERVVAPLILAGILRSERGPGGGVRLVKETQEVTLTQIVLLTEGSLAPVECVDDVSYCSRHRACVTRELWSDLRYAVTQYLDSITLEDLVQRHKKKIGELPIANTYDI